MRALLLTVAVLALAACNKPADTNVTNDVALNADENMAADNMADANMIDSNMAAPAALTTINHTSWAFKDSKTGKDMQESIDDSGKYITQAGKEHIDHGTAVMKDGKACFTSAMNKDGEMCWTDPMIAPGQSGTTTSDKGEKLAIKRTDYVALTM